MNAQQSNTTSFIVWNGCDGYKMAVEGEELFTRTERHEAFAVGQEITEADVPRDEDDELDFDGLFLTEGGRIFRAL